MLTLEQRLAISTALVPYGARLTEDDRIAKGDKVMSVALEIKGGRLRVLGGGNLFGELSGLEGDEGRDGLRREVLVLEAFLTRQATPPAAC